MNNSPLTAKDFSPDLTRVECLIGWIYLPIHIFLLPILLGMLQALYPGDPISSGTINLIYYGIGLLVIFLCFARMLRREFDRLCDRPLQCVYAICAGWCAWYLAMMVISLLTEQFLPDWPDNPANTTMESFHGRDFRTMKAVAIFLAPLVEEPLFRGVAFQSLRKRSRALAYAVSVGLFCIYHVWQYAVAWQDPVLLLYALEYIPITLAITWSYERSGSLWTPMVFHGLNNLISFMAYEAMM